MQLSVLNNAGWEDTVLWSPYGDEGMGYNNFVCVESVKVRWQISVFAFVERTSYRSDWHGFCFLTFAFILSIQLIYQFDPVTLDGGASWTGDMALKAGAL